jgi:acetyl esterase/lipase
MRRTTLLGAMAAAGSALLSACSPLGLLNTASGTEADRVPDLGFGPDPRQRLDFYRPRAGTGPWPVVLFFYGGAWESGSRAGYRFAGHALASRGFLTAVADYRLYPQVRWPDFLRDGALAAKWLVEHARDHGGDPARLHLMGHSSGAYNAAMLAIDRRWLGEVGLDPRTAVRSWVGLSGPYDFLPIREPNVKIIFGPESQWPDTQPVAHVSTGAPPALLIHGDADERVRPRNSRNLAAKLQAANVPVQLVVYPDVGHAKTVVALARPFRGTLPVLDTAADFLARG